MKKMLLVFIFATLAFAAFAGGRKDNESHEVSNPAGFSESVNIEKKKTGKWNFYLEAKDSGGNTSIAGPHNIYFDPESDLPVTRIINPMPEMRIQGNLNLVGTCIDDDGVAYVELEITRGRDGKGESMLRVRAEGTEFWSYYLDTSDSGKWTDGAYTVTAWGVDINGLSGISDKFPAKSHKKSQLVWNLDRKKPEIRVTSHEMGALVSGKVTIAGTVWDGNGIDSLLYSLDDGLSFQSVNLKYDNKSKKYNFSLNIDTKLVEDGPAVILFKAKDNMRTEGQLSFLMFVNNIGPEVKILYPEDNEAVSGIFTVAGYAMHNVGLASLSWKLGKESGDLPLIKGNPWWVKEFDIRGQNVKSLDLEIRAVDISGNVSVAKRKIPVDIEAGRPRVTLNEPAAGTIVGASGMNLVGFASDKTGVESILYSLDGKAPVELSGFDTFRYCVKDIPAGTHTLEVWARNRLGVEGPKVNVKNIVVQGKEPEAKISQVRTGTGKSAAVANFYSGMEINKEAGSSFDLVINSDSALAAISYQIGSKDPVSVAIRGSKGGEFVQNIPIPKDIESGLVRAEITIKDVYNNETSVEEYFVTAGAHDTGTFAWVGANTKKTEDGRIVLSAGEPLTGVSGRGPLQSVAITGNGAASLDASVDEYGRVILSGSADGNYGPMRFNLTGSDGVSFTSREEYRFLVDSEAPQLIIVEEPDAQWVQNYVQVKFQAADKNKIKKIECSADFGASWRQMLTDDEIARLNPNSLIERSLDISSHSDGAITLTIRVSDEAGKETLKSFVVYKDTTAPEAQVIVPSSGFMVNGKIRLGIAVKEAGRLKSVYYERSASVNAGKTVPAISRQVYPDPEKPGTSPGFLELLLDPNEMPLADDMSLVFIDMAGNKFTLSQWSLVIDNESDLPVVQISLPLENEVITSDFIISGVCYDDDAVKCIYWRMDDGYEYRLDAKNSFAIAIPISSMTDNEHKVSIYAEDIYGVKGKVETRNFRVSLEAPTVFAATPMTGEIVGGTVRITGIAMDNNGIQRVQVSLDNGNSFNDAEGTTRWSYSFNSKIIPDGNHPVFVRAWDNYGITSMYSFLINIDNTPPELAVDMPHDGSETTGPLYITGQVMDKMKLDSVTIKISSLDGVTIPPHLAEKKAKLDSLILEEMNIGALPDGNYNVEIWAVDMAGNTSRVSRNIVLAKENQRNFVETLYPLNGEYVQGNFNLYGMVGGIDKAATVDLIVNNLIVKSEPVGDSGYFRFEISKDDLVGGTNRISVRSDFEGKEVVLSPVKLIQYQADGPWVTVDTLNMGDFAFERPWLMGRAGYELSDADMELLADKKADKDLRAAIEAKKPAFTELSFNNGRTFIKASKAYQKGYDWRYRLETQDMSEGPHYLIVRTTMLNGEIALTRLLIQVDKKPPVIRLISPESGGLYNGELNFAALASDDVELQSLKYHLRKGDKSAYEIPGFIKGLYFEATIPPFVKQIWNDAPGIFSGGATYMDVGFGLSFFGDNVKLQVQYGFLTQSLFESLGGEKRVRYGGHVLGFKLLANVYTLPFAVFGGPDWEWLSASFALGANFSLFDLLQEGYTQSGNSTWMTAVLAQIEFPKVTLSNRSYLRTFSLFTEGQLWFVPTDVDAKANNVKTVIPHIILGLRMYIF